MRFAFVVIAETSDPGDYWEKLATEVGGPEVRYVGNPCVVPDGEEYATDGLRIGVEDEVFVTHPTLLERAEDGDPNACQVLREVGIALPNTEPCAICGGTMVGVLYPTMANGDAARQWIERCDECSEYETDDDAAQALVDAGVIPAFVLAHPPGSSSWVPYAVDDDGAPLLEGAGFSPADAPTFKVRVFPLIEGERGLTAEKGPEIVCGSDESPVTALAVAGEHISDWLRRADRRPLIERTVAFDIRLEAPRKT